MKDFELFKEATEGKTLDDLVKKIKKLPLYEIYKHKVEENATETADLLESLTLLSSLSDQRLSALVTCVSMKLLFSVIDQKLKNEILNESEGNNDEKSKI